MWVPDVYHGAPTPITLLIGVGAEARDLRRSASASWSKGLLPLAADWQQMLIVLAVALVVLGNLAAIAQSNLKRMLAYSTIAQMGFVLLGLLSGVVGGDAARRLNAYSAAMFYVVTYVLTTLGTFGIMLLLSRAGFEAEKIADFKGLNRRSPWYAFVMLLLMFSLAGVPPTVGLLRQAGRAAGAAGRQLRARCWLAIIAVLFSLVGAFYYLRVVKVMYFDEPTAATRSRRRSTCAWCSRSTAY